MEKFGINIKNLAKIKVIANKAGFPSIAKYFESGKHNKVFQYIDLEAGDVVKLRKTVNPDGTYAKHFYNKSGKGKLKSVQGLIQKNKVYRGVSGGTKENPLAGIDSEKIFSAKRQTEVGKTTHRYWSPHPEVAADYGHLGDKSSLVIKSDFKTLGIKPSKYTIHGHVGTPGRTPSESEINKVIKVFKEGKIPKKEFPKGTHGHQQIPTYETTSTIEGLPSKFEALVTLDKKNLVFKNLGEMNPSQAVKKMKSVSKKSKLFYE